MAAIVSWLFSRVVSFLFFPLFYLTKLLLLLPTVSVLCVCVCVSTRVCNPDGERYLFPAVQNRLDITVHQFQHLLLHSFPLPPPPPHPMRWFASNQDQSGFKWKLAGQNLTGRQGREGGGQGGAGGRCSRRHQEALNRVQRSVAAASREEGWVQGFGGGRGQAWG